LKNKLYIFFSLASEYALYGLLFFLPISNALIESFAGLALFGFVGRKIIKPDFKYLKFWPNIFLLLFLFFSASSLLNSGAYLRISLNALFGKWMQYLGICIIMQDNLYDNKIIKRAMVVFLISASLAVLSGLTQYFFGVEFLRNRGSYATNSGISVATSSFAHYNGFGGYLVVVLSFLLAVPLSTKMHKLKTYSLLILTILSIVAIFLTLSRGSWIALFASLIFLAILSKKNLRQLIPVFLLVIAMFLFPVFRERLLFVFQHGGDSDRFKYWLAAWKMVSEHPLIGMGVGTFMANFSKYEPHAHIAYAHNCYLQIWAETGIFSLISLLVFISSLIYLGIKKFFVSKDFLLLGLLTGVAGFLVHSFFEVNFYSLQLVILLWVWIGLILGIINDATKAL